MVDTAPRPPQSLVIYQVFPRNHGPLGGFRDVTSDLDRIAALGVDVLYLMPIHPIGVIGRKGALGSPYAISDYRRVNPELGTEADLDDLIAAAHDRGLRVIMDVVFNHTSPDSVLVREHPEFFHRDEHGTPVTTVPAWTDIIDFAHPQDALTRYLIDSLAGWVRRGVDGFRCDVASLVPRSLWQQARAELENLSPGLLWVAETPHPSWVAERRAAGLPTHSDAEMLEVFDIAYQYDLWSIWQACVVGDVGVGRFLEMVRWQQSAYPEGAAKLRFVENHDNFRIMRFARNRESAQAWTALMALLPGPFMVYAGQESGAVGWPSLFERDPVDWADYRLAPFLAALIGVKHRIEPGSRFVVVADEPVVQVGWAAPRVADTEGAGELPVAFLGILNVSGEYRGEIVVSLPDGTYPDLLGGPDLVVRSGRSDAPASAHIVEVPPAGGGGWHPEQLATPLLDVFLHVEQLGDAPVA